MWIGSGTDLWVDSMSAGLNGRSLWLEEESLVRGDNVALSYDNELFKDVFRVSSTLFLLYWIKCLGIYE
jgi:hypothetical protein